MKKPIRGSLGIILTIVLSLHITLLLLKFSTETARETVNDAEIPLKVRILKEKKQIVQSEDSEDRRTKDNSFLSDKDRSFDRESMSRKIDSFKEATKGGGRPESKTKEKMKLSDLGDDSDPFETAAKELSESKDAPAGENIQAEKEVSSTNDYVQEVPLGDVTHLNTSEYKYYGYYHRIRQRLEQFWGASIQEQAESLAREGRQLSSSEQLVTSLQITLDDEGEIISMRLLDSSGVRELDDAAIESFNDAGPFPNPPEGLIINGRVTIEWGFVVQT
jgi:TonB family protein